MADNKWIRDLGVFQKHNIMDEFHAPAKDKEMNDLKAKLKKAEDDAKRLNAALMTERLERGNDLARHKTEVKMLKAQIQESDDNAKQLNNVVKNLQRLVQCYSYAAQMLKEKTRTKFYGHYAVKRQEIHDAELNAS